MGNPVYNLVYYFHLWLQSDFGHYPISIHLKALAPKPERQESVLEFLQVCRTLGKNIIIPSKISRYWCMRVLHQIINQELQVWFA